jgi:cold shock CspA family protein
MNYQDKLINCRDCGGQFVFTAGEQEFYDTKGFLNAPTRCPLRRRQIKGMSHDPVSPNQPCPHDDSGRGRYPSETPFAGRNSYTRGSDRSYSRRSAPTDVPNLTDDFVAATVVRIDSSGRFVFVNVPALNQDAYVHANVLATLNTQPHEQQRVLVKVSNSDRGLRATAIKEA